MNQLCALLSNELVGCLKKKLVGEGGIDVSRWWSNYFCILNFRVGLAFHPPLGAVYYMPGQILLVWDARMVCPLRQGGSFFREEVLRMYSMHGICLPLFTVSCLVHERLAGLI